MANKDKQQVADLYNSLTSEQKADLLTIMLADVEQKKAPQRKTMRLTCNNCQAIMTVDSDHEILTCPYCGNAELIQYSDTVEVERIKASLEKEKMAQMREKELLKQKEDAYAMRVLTILSVIILVMLFALVLLAPLKNTAG